MVDKYVENVDYKDFVAVRDLVFRNCFETLGDKLYQDTYMRGDFFDSAELSDDRTIRAEFYDKGIKSNVYRDFEKRKEKEEVIKQEIQVDSPYPRPAIDEFRKYIFELLLEEHERSSFIVRTRRGDDWLAVRFCEGVVRDSQFPNIEKECSGIL